MFLPPNSAGVASKAANITPTEKGDRPTQRKFIPPAPTTPPGQSASSERTVEPLKKARSQATMNRIFEAGFWLDLGHRIGGIFGNLFRWVFGTKRRLLTVLVCLVALFIVWSFGKLESQRQAALAAPVATATPSATAKACVKPNANTPAGQAAANVAVRVCQSPTYNDPRRNATSRALTITTGTAPEPSVVERFAFNVPNKVEQVGGADAQGITTVLATSSKSKFLLGFADNGTLASVRDITETPDVTPTVEPTQGAANGTQSATTSTPTPAPTSTGKKP
jgi:hypothetical protein